MRREDIENAILITFLDANDNGEDLSDIYKLDMSIFTSPFRKRVAEKINEEDEDAYGFLSFTIEESCVNTSSAHEFMEMSSQNSLGLSFSKKYHDKLIADDKLEDLC